MQNDSVAKLRLNRTKAKKGTYQFFALHALHQHLEQMDGIAVAEVKGLLDGCYDIRFNSIRETTGSNNTREHGYTSSGWTHNFTGPQ